MQTNPRGVWLKVGVFALLTLLFSSVFWVLIFAAGSLQAGEFVLVAGIMWCPGLAALATKAIVRESVCDLGWSWGNGRYNLWGYLLPVAIALPVYLLVWCTSLGGFYNTTFVEKTQQDFGWQALPAGLAICLYVSLVVTAGMVRNTAFALGEEIGWRGFLVPELVKVVRPGTAALLTGLFWAAWHYPVLLFSNYNSGTPWWVGLPCFTAMVVADSFIAAYLRLRSGSVWPAVILHASHNTWIQMVFTPLTIDTGPTKYIIDEFGVGLVISCAMVAGILWWLWKPEMRESEVYGQAPNPLLQPTEAATPVSESSKVAEAAP